MISNRPARYGYAPPPWASTSLSRGKSVQHAGHQHRADAERGVERVLRNLSQTEFRRTRRWYDQHRMDQDGQAEGFRPAPERVERQLAEIGVLDIGGDDHAACAQVGGTFELLGSSFGSSQWNGGNPGKPIGIVRAPVRQRVIQHPVPGDARVDGEAVAENVRPSADDLQVDALLVEPSAPLRDRLDQPREERANLESVIERQSRRPPGGRRHQAYPYVFASGGDRVDQLRWNIMGVDIDRHAAPLRFQST